MKNEEARYLHADLKRFAAELLCQSGMKPSISEVVADVLVEGDLLGKSTHVLQLLGPYLKSIAAGEMKLSGTPRILKQKAGNTTMDGEYLPGPFVVRHAVEQALERIGEFGVVTTVIRRSHHIACLQAYLKPVTDLGYMMVLMSSDPSAKSVSAYGGVKPVCTPNPFAVGIQTSKDPILIDVSASTTTNGRSMQLHKLGETFSSPCLLTSEGAPTNDPGVLFAEPPGTIQPLGGMDFGHKGFALAILVETLTSALSGYGRVDAPKQWGSSVYLQLIDPECFGGVENYRSETGFFAETCRASGSGSPGASVRMPGEQGLERRASQLKDGVRLYQAIMPSLEKWASQLGVEVPRPIGS